MTAANAPPQGDEAEEKDRPRRYVLTPRVPGSDTTEHAVGFPPPDHDAWWESRVIPMGEERDTDDKLRHTRLPEHSFPVAAIFGRIHKRGVRATPQICGEPTVGTLQFARDGVTIKFSHNSPGNVLLCIGARSMEVLLRVPVLIGVGAVALGCGLARGYQTGLAAGCIVAFFIAIVGALVPRRGPSRRTRRGRKETILLSFELIEDLICTHVGVRLKALGGFVQANIPPKWLAGCAECVDVIAQAYPAFSGVTELARKRAQPEVDTRPRRGKKERKRRR